MRKIIIVILAVFGISYQVSAQSKDFKLGKWTEIQNALIKELNAGYVDSLQVDRIPYIFQRKKTKTFR